MTSTRVAVLGTGLVGTSIAMAAVRAGDAVRGWDGDGDHAERAADRGGFRAVGSLDEAVHESELVIVATPIATLGEVVVRALAAAPRAVVTDAGSVKGVVVAEVTARATADEAARFVGGHPMGGSERSGPEHASASVVDDIVWVLTPGPGTAPEAVDRLEAWVRSIGARPIRMDPSRHDRLVGFVSHLPQVASTSLMGLVADEEADEPEILLLAAGGFRDLTRLAASNPGLWSEILLSNREAVVDAVDLYVERLTRLRDLIGRARGEDVRAAFAAAKAARLTLAAKPQVRSGVAVIQVPIPDRPGALAQLTAALGESGVNIEDLQIVHSPEGGRGTVHLTVAATAADVASTTLAAHGFDPTRLA
jgi:prephenate dehydrogenase